MRSITQALLLTLATVALTSSAKPLDLVEDLIAAPSSLESSSVGVPAAPPPPVKLDKNLRRALLKALVDLEAESAEQHQQNEQQEQSTSSSDSSEERSTERTDDEDKYAFLEISKQNSASFSFNSFPGDEEDELSPSEDKLQNSSFVESDKYEARKDSENHRRPNSLHFEPPKDYTRGVQVHEVVASEKPSAIYGTKAAAAEHVEDAESRRSPDSSNQIQKSVSFAPISETLTASASGSLASAAANALVAPRPTPSTKLASEASEAGTGNGTAATRPRAGAGSKLGASKREEAEEVKIFQAPLVAAFTVQQDERGVPKSVVPLYRASNGTSPAQPLSLQEQLEFKQRLLEKQLFQLQQQQTQQAHFLIRQRQAYEEQLRQKQQQQQQQRQQQDFFLHQQRILQQQQQISQPLQQFVRPPPQRQPFQQQQQPQLNLIQQLPLQQALQRPFNPLPAQQSFKPTTVQLQPSLSLEVPNVLAAPPFQSHQLRTQQQLPQAQQFQQFTIRQQPQQQQLEFQQPPALAAPLNRFNRQEAFGSVGNFGFNSFPTDENKAGNNIILRSNNQAQLVQSRPLPVQNGFNFVPFRQHRPINVQPPTTPARQIQDLLYQSGIATDLQSAGTRNQEDINIVSKVLALNVGSLPTGQRTKINFPQQQQFGILKK